MEAVEEVVCLNHLDDSPWSLDVMQSLVDKSLVRAIQDDRFDLFVSVREYATEKLIERREQADAQERHANYFKAFGTTGAVQAVYRHGGPGVLGKLNLEFDNLMVALRSGIRLKSPTIALCGLRAIAEVIEQQGPYGTFARLAQEISDELPLSRRERGELLLIQGRMHRVCGDREASLRCLEEAIVIGVEESFAELEVGGRINKAMMLGFVNGVEESERAWKEARHAAELHEQEVALADVILALGQARLFSGQMDAALTLMRDGLERAEKMGNEFAMVRALIGLAYQDVAFTEEGIRRAGELLERLDNPRDEVTFLAVKAYHSFHTKRDFHEARAAFSGPSRCATFSVPFEGRELRTRIWATSSF